MREKVKLVDPLSELKQINPLGVVTPDDVQDIAFCTGKVKRSFIGHIKNRFMKKEKNETITKSTRTL